MSLTITNSKSSGEFQSVEPGNYVGTFIMAIDLGTQRTEYLGEVKNQHKIFLRLELNEYMDDERPFIIGSTYTASMHEKATLRKLIEGARGKSLSESEASSFDMASLLGKSCMVNITANEKGGKTYTNIQALTKLPKGMTVPELQNPIVYFDIDAWDQATFDALPNFLQSKITESAEFKLRGAKPDVPSKPAPAPVEVDDDKDSLPF